MCIEDLVSVIIPVYNREKLVCQAIDSVIQQSYSFIEVIIADDGSTDKTLSVLEKYATLPGVRILSLKHCGNPGQVRNAAVKLARGQWLAFLDSDDIWMKDKIEKQVDFLKQNPSYKFIHTLERWERKGKIISQSHRKHQKEGDLFKISLGKCEIGPSTVIMERDLFNELGGFREDLEICEDYEFWLRVTSVILVAYINEELVVKRAGHDGQLSAKYGFIELFKINALIKLVDQRYFKEEKQILARRELAGKCRIYSGGCRKRGKEKEAEDFESLYFSYSADDA